ncbi:conserved hypothetical protein [Thiomonas arsenitoxydans]|nr:hypothetical protein [Thiomonas arsenitoxydans]CQR45525.1 conserved hypothetical protein [Thiomonas sp. CB3]CQR33896.1 conserved hypothetical protein [Thiomonas arsenitoxydans]CQR35527.1 conserved hypothetical protein [Thiomonas arsenitoxydans]CQR37763.1 conserved hypothetical protein [Thiomonas arsenitoxydans]CQR37903.1 conserved hypothetical protein [Thiomonas arsenitoxydans]
MASDKRPAWLLLWMEANVAMMQYHSHKGGVALFRAYQLHRKAAAAWRADPEAQRAEAASSSRDQAGRGHIWKSGSDVLAEQRELLLSDLDDVVDDLNRVFERWSGHADHLTELVAALRVGRISPSAAKRQAAWWRVQELMIQRYLDMQDDRRFISKSALLERVGAELGVSRPTALAAWEGFLKGLPHQKAWVERIAAAAKRRASSKQEIVQAKKPRQQAQVVKATKRAKPQKSAHFRLMKLSSGRRLSKPKV